MPPSEDRVRQIVRGLCGRIWRLGLDTPTGIPTRVIERRGLEPSGPPLPVRPGARRRVATPWFWPIGRPNTTRSFAYCAAMRSAAHRCRWPPFRNQDALRVEAVQDVTEPHPSRRCGRPRASSPSMKSMLESTAARRLVDPRTSTRCGRVGCRQREALRGAFHLSSGVVRIGSTCGRRLAQSRSDLAACSHSHHPTAQRLVLSRVVWASVGFPVTAKHPSRRASAAAKRRCSRCRRPPGLSEDVHVDADHPQRAGR
jgi:hypothetical protein